MGLSLFIMFFYSSVSLDTLSQDTTILSDWQSIEIIDSKSFFEVESFTDKSYEWSTEDQSYFFEKLAEAGSRLDIDSISYLSYLNLGYHYSNIDSLEFAIKYLTLANSFTYSLGSECQINNGLGLLYERFHDYDTALEYYFKSVKKGIEEGKGHESNALVNLSMVYKTLEDYPNTIKYLKRSIESVSPDIGTPEYQYSNIFNYAYLVMSQVEQGDLDSLDEHLELISEYIDQLKGYQEYRYATTRYMGYYALAFAHLEQGAIELAKNYFDLAVEDSRGSFGQALTILDARIKIREKNYSSAITLLRGIENQNLVESNNDVLKLQIECYSKMNNFVKVEEVYEKYISSLKSNYKENQNKFITLANTKFDLYEKNKEILRLENEHDISSITITNQRNLMILSLLLFVILTGLLYALWDRNKKKKELNTRLQVLVDEKTQNLQKANSELKMFNYIASHDLKEPLTTIKAYSDLVQREIKVPNERLTTYFDFINISLSQSRSLLENIMRFWKSYEDANVEFESVDLNILLISLTKSIDQFIIESGAQIIIESLPEVRSNEALLFSVFKNVIENGIKFNESNVPIIKISSTVKDDYLRISIADNGIGISSENQEKIFKSFNKLHNKSQYEGSGLGLAIAKNLIDKLDGKITLESQVGSGTTFLIDLPHKASK